MIESECIAYRPTGYFSQLICDYLDQDPSLQGLYEDYPRLENFKPAMERRRDFPKEHRKRLVKSLREQYATLQDYQADDAVAANVEALGEKDTFTVTTGHQLNILTGPLYFIYKIVSTINLARKLSDSYPDRRFVPVYWMASEDHDFEEISFVNLQERKLRWEHQHHGPVGALANHGMGKVLDELEKMLGSGQNAQELVKLFRRAYHDHDNLSQATRYIAHQLFGMHGLVVLDADDASLKELFLPHMKADLWEHKAAKTSQAATEMLAKKYFAQIHVRSINLFYLQPGSRQRIVKEEDQWRVLDTSKTFSESELQKELQEHPEHFSPNVALRPLYQEVILPNLAYIGGGGELAYWLQLKDFFDSSQVVFPLLVLRNSVLWVEEKWQNRMADLKLSAREIMQPLDKLKNDRARQTAPIDPDMKEYEERLESMFDELEKVAELTEESMLGAVNAQRQKQLKGIAKLRKKLLRAEKRKHSVDMAKLDRIHGALFPKGQLQERYANLSEFYASHGRGFIEALEANLDPLDFRFCILKPDNQG